MWQSQAVVLWEQLGRQLAHPVSLLLKAGTAAATQGSPQAPWPSSSTMTTPTCHTTGDTTTTRQWLWCYYNNYSSSGEVAAEALCHSPRLVWETAASTEVRTTA